ncbi:helix-turn-helix transcriptional regulator [Sinomonas sp. R1AF57]|uniref:helix-turn-helix transcriptional regulator n=1 Tax=Sinomonas sp. R1AF57 TaxID=2020377 RepID=UPI000B61AB63|nr:helix-turn-helix transcriptional regulator [Sinomonas sp. R1AF57]ASN53409.1 transcriptional regulator [Sinomonas sp. R1AF57]
MDNRSEIREFLATRRAKLTPEQAGLPAFGGNRRVPGLRREEVALLAGVSAEYYTKLERGALAGVSESVLEALTRALQLTDAETAHLYDLARAASRSSRPRRRPAPAVTPSIQRLLDSMDGVPAFVRNGRLDILAINDLGRALYSEAYASGSRPVNLARFQFLDPRSHNLYPDWEKAADTAVAILRTEAGRDPYDKSLTDLVGELSTRSDEFRTRWAMHDVRLHRGGYKDFRHPAVGDLHLAFDALDIPNAPGLTLTAYTADPGTPSEDGLRLLASWAATETATTKENA